MLINWPQNNQGLQPLAYIFLVNQEWSALCQNIVCGREGFVNTKSSRKIHCTYSQYSMLSKNNNGLNKCDGLAISEN